LDAELGNDVGHSKSKIHNSKFHRRCLSGSGPGPASGLPCGDVWFAPLTLRPVSAVAGLCFFVRPGKHSPRCEERGEVENVSRTYLRRFSLSSAAWYRGAAVRLR